VHRKYDEAVVGGLIEVAGIGVPRSAEASGIPRAAYLLHEFDQSFPIVTREHWAEIYSALSDASRQVELSAKPTIQELNALTRHARDMHESDGRRVTRSELDYVAKALLFVGRLSEDMTAPEIAGVFTQATLTRCQTAGLGSDDVAQMGPWLDPYSDDVENGRTE
jgi:hypothetical protein